MDGTRQTLIEYLSLAHASETALERTLEAHSAMALDGTYKDRLESHLGETRRHASLVRRRLDELGATRSPVQAGVALVQSLAGQGLALAKGPVDMIRSGFNVEEKMVKNARDEAMTEALEIATYDVIARMASNLGDDKTAELAEQIRDDEEAMLEDLRAEIPALVDQMVRAKLPPSRRATGLTTMEPWPGYDDMTAGEIREQLDGASAEVLMQVRRYEQANKNRSTVLEQVERKRESITA